VGYRFGDDVIEAGCNPSKALESSTGRSRFNGNSTIPRFSDV
jgi:hypothetical protein